MGFRIYTNKQKSFMEERHTQVYTTKEDYSKNVFPSFPKTSLVELSNGCNHACIFCTNSRMERKIGRLSLELYEEFLKQATDLGLEEVGLYTTGEPFLMKNINDYIKLAKKYGIKYVFITTNGALTSPEKLVSAIEAGLDSIKFSVNAGSKESYRLVHGKDDFDKVINNIKFLSNYREKNNIDLKLMVSCVVTKEVEDEQDLLKDLILPYIDEIVFYGVNSQFGQSLDQIKLLKSNLSDDPPPIGTADPCSMIWNRVHVTREGYLTLCCADYENALTYADLNSTTLKEAWHNSTITNMRKRHKTQCLDGTLCKNCLYGTEEAHYPLSDIGHKEVSKPLKSEKKRGIISVAKRIKELANLKKEKKWK
jgi:molybdenum cofactor biosynthesis enzyme MoaA